MKIYQILIIVITLSFVACTNDAEEIRKELNAGTKANANSQFKKAITHFNNVLEIDSTYAEAYLQIGNSNFNLGKYNKAMEMYDKAIALDPKYGQAYKSRAQLHKLNRNRDAACKDFLKAEELGVENLYNETKFCK